MDILDGAEVDINCKHVKHMQQRVQFSPIISLWEFQKFKLKYIENILMKFRENFTTAVKCHYLVLIIPTECLITLNAYGSPWCFLNFRRYKSMAISADKIEVHCLRNGSFKFLITFRVHAHIHLLGSGGTALQ